MENTVIAASPLDITFIGKTWKTCKIHGPDNPGVWGCPECMRELREENKRLLALLDEAADEIADWGSYASDYFKNKHDLPGCVAKYRLTPNAGDEATGAALCDRPPRP